MNKNNIFIYSAPKHSGKTTKVLEWIKGRTRIAGILSPDIDQHRYFLDIQSQNMFLMEAVPTDTDVYIIGKYIFSKHAFQNAELILRNAFHADVDWVIIDEIGPLELKSLGFHNVLIDLLKLQKKNFCILLLVRDTLVQEVIGNYEIGDAIVVQSIHNLDIL